MPVFTRARLEVSKNWTISSFSVGVHRAHVVFNSIKFCCFLLSFNNHIHTHTLNWFYNLNEVNNNSRNKHETNISVCVCDKLQKYQKCTSIHCLCECWLAASQTAHKQIEQWESEFMLDFMPSISNSTIEYSNTPLANKCSTFICIPPGH